MEESPSNQFSSLFEERGAILKKVGWNFVGTWYFYRIFHSTGKLLFVNNDDKDTEISISSQYKSLDKICVSTSNYLGIYYPEENKIVIYSKLLKQHASVSFPKGYHSHSFVETPRGPIVVMIIGRQIKIYSIDFEKEVASYHHDSPIYCGVKGIYKNLENRVVCMPYFPSDESFELPPFVQKITGVIPTHESIDMVFTEEDLNKSFIYDTESKTILYRVIGRVRSFDFLFLTKNKIIDFRSKELPSLYFKEIVFITKKDDEKGYYIWKL